MTKLGIEPGSTSFLHTHATNWAINLLVRIRKNRSLCITRNLSSEEKAVTVKKKPVSVKKTPLQWRKNPFQWRKNRYSEEKNRYFFLLLFIPNFSWQFIATFFLSFFLHFPWLFYHFLQWVLWLYTQKYPENWKKQSVHFFFSFFGVLKIFLTVRDLFYLHSEVNNWLSKPL